MVKMVIVFVSDHFSKSVLVDIDCLQESAVTRRRFSEFLLNVYNHRNTKRPECSQRPWLQILNTKYT